jgi:ferredoxin
MRIILDEDACTGHGRCYDIAPELFGADDAGHSVLLAAGVPAEREAAARRAAANCPEQAITVVARP